MTDIVANMEALARKWHEGAYRRGPEHLPYIATPRRWCPELREVVIPTGRYRTGGLVLRSGVTLHLAEGAELEGDRDPDNYPGKNRWYLARTFFTDFIRNQGGNPTAVAGAREALRKLSSCDKKE